jgi:uncharacterized protein (DUF58 family)
MKKLFILLFVILFGAAPALAQPEVTVDAPVYTFEPVFEGSHVTHTFVVKNTGDTPFKILEVLPP